MYPEAIDRLPDTRQSQPDGQPLPLLPRKYISEQEKRLCPGKMAIFGGGGLRLGVHPGIVKGGGH